MIIMTASWIKLKHSVYFGSLSIVNSIRFKSIVQGSNFLDYFLSDLTRSLFVLSLNIADKELVTGAEEYT